MAAVRARSWRRIAAGALAARRRCRPTCSRSCPRPKSDPAAEKATDTLAAALGDRTVFIVSSPDAEHAKAAAKQLGAMLRIERGVPVGDAQLPPFDVSSIAAFYLPYRFGLLAPADRAALQDGSFVLRDALAAAALQSARQRARDAPRRRPVRLAATLPRGLAARDVESGTGGRHARRPSRRRD